MRTSRMLVLSVMIVLGLIGALVPISATAQDGNGVVVIEGITQTNDTDQTNEQVQVQVPDQQQIVDQANLQVSEQVNAIFGESFAAADADDDDAVVGDTSSSSSTGDSNLANSNPQTATNQNAQHQEVVGGNQANAPVSTNVQTTEVVISDVGGEVDTSTNVTIENVGNDSFNIDESTTFSGDLAALLALLGLTDDRTVTISILGTANTPGDCQVVAAVEGFEPGTYDVTVVAVYEGDTLPPQTFSQYIDADGIVFDQPVTDGVTLTVTVDGVSSGPVLVECGGV